MSSNLNEIIKKEHLEGLIGKTHQLILQTLLKSNKTYSEIFDEVNGKEYITSQWQVIRATDQLKRIGCTKVVGSRRTGFMAAPMEDIFSITDIGKQLMNQLQKQE